MSKTLYSPLSPSPALLSSYLSPLTTPGNVAIAKYTHANFAPVLLAGLAALGTVVENDVTNTDVTKPPPSADGDTEDADTASMELRIYFAKTVNKTISLGIEKCYKNQPSDPVDYLANFFFQESCDEMLEPEMDEAVNPLQFLAQYLYRHNPIHSKQDGE